MDRKLLTLLTLMNATPEIVEAAFNVDLDDEVQIEHIIDELYLISKEPIPDHLYKYFLLGGANWTGVTALMGNSWVPGYYIFTDGENACLKHKNNTVKYNKNKFLLYQDIFNFHVEYPTKDDSRNFLRETIRNNK